MSEYFALQASLSFAIFHILAAIFLRDLEAVTTRVVVGAVCTVLGTILIVTL
jgi:hypothetical protein